MVKAILFDLDGTILDTSEFILQAFEHSLKHQGITDVKRSHMIKKMGPALTEMYKILAPQANMEQFVRSHRDFQADNLALSRPFPQVPEVLQKIHKSGIKIGAVTSRSNENSIKTLELADIKQYFEIVVSFEDVKNPKPDPEGVLMALKYMNVRPVDTMMVGDTYVDVEAGRSAGTKTVGITHGMRGDDVKISNPDYLISSISELLEIIEI